MWRYSRPSIRRNEHSFSSMLDVPEVAPAVGLLSAYRRKRRNSKSDGSQHAGSFRQVAVSAGDDEVANRPHPVEAQSSQPVLPLASMVESSASPGRRVGAVIA